VTWLALVTLPVFKFTEVAFSTKLPLWPRFNDPLFVKEPDALSVSVAELFAPSAPALELIFASLATVRLPCTATITLAVSKAVEIADAVLASITISSGSSNQFPFLPCGADVSTITLGAMVN
jgi:hypothetical protein